MTTIDLGNMGPSKFLYPEPPRPNHLGDDMHHDDDDDDDDDDDLSLIHI